MPKFTYTGPDGNHYPTLLNVVDGETVRGLVPVPGETYDLRFERHDADPEDAKVTHDPGDGNWERVKPDPAAIAAKTLTPAEVAAKTTN